MALILNRVRPGHLRSGTLAQVVAWTNLLHIPILGVIPEAESEPDTLDADHPWHQYARFCWRQMQIILAQASITARHPQAPHE
jgi:hypothetical protein